MFSVSILWIHKISSFCFRFTFFNNKILWYLCYYWNYLTINFFSVIKWSFFRKSSFWTWSSSWIIKSNKLLSTVTHKLIKQFYWRFNVREKVRKGKKMKGWNKNSSFKLRNAPPPFITHFRLSPSRTSIVILLLVFSHLGEWYCFFVSNEPKAEQIFEASGTAIKYNPFL